MGCCAIGIDWALHFSVGEFGCHRSLVGSPVSRLASGAGDAFEGVDGRFGPQPVHGFNVPPLLRSEKSCFNCFPALVPGFVSLLLFFWPLLLRPF